MCLAHRPFFFSAVKLAKVDLHTLLMHLRQVLLLFSFFLIIFFAILGLYLIGQIRHERGERGGTTCSKGPHVGVEPAAVVARTDPLYMGEHALPW